jgi:hypothetical protein
MRSPISSSAPALSTLGVNPSAIEARVKTRKPRL